MLAQLQVDSIEQGCRPALVRTSHRHAQELFSTLREQVLREFHDRDEQGIPRAWIARVKASLRTNGPGFAAGRMLRDYESRLYEVGAPTS